MRLAVGIAVSAFALTSCASGGSGQTGSIATTGSGDDQVVTVDSTDDLTFVPNTINAQVGKVAITLTNGGKVPHDLAFSQKSLGATSLVRGGDQTTLPVRFSEAGTFSFVCTIHPGMDGTVVVTAGS